MPYCSCSCQECSNASEQPDFGDGLNELGLEDLDIAPALDELLQDPLLGHALLNGFAEDEFPDRTDSPPSGPDLESGMHQSKPASSSDSFVMVPASSGSYSSPKETAVLSTSSQSPALAAQSRQGSPYPEFAQPTIPTTGELVFDWTKWHCYLHIQTSARVAAGQQAHSEHSGSPSMHGSAKGEHESPPSPTADGAKTDSELVSDAHQKKHARMMRNRESAQMSRQRKKMQLEVKEQHCQQLQGHNAHLAGRLYIAWVPHKP